MAKRMTKAEMQIFFWIVVIGLPIYGVMQLGESVGWLPFVLGLVLVVGLVVWFRSAKKKKRRESLINKYRNSELVDALMNGRIWQGQSAGQLLDSLGRPRQIDQKRLKTKKKEVWKYEHQGGNRYGLRITLDNDEVVGWDRKS